VGASEPKQNHGLEQSGLAGRIWSPDELRSTAELDVQRRIAPEIPDRQRAKDRRRSLVRGDWTSFGDLRLLGGRLDRHDDVRVLRVADRPEDAG
jgi:hypothetical protein